MWLYTKNYSTYRSCSSKLQSQHSAENLAETEGKLEGKLLLLVHMEFVELAIQVKGTCIQVYTCNPCRVSYRILS